MACVVSRFLLRQRTFSGALLLQKLASKPVEANALDMMAVTDADLVVVTGMTLCKEFIKNSGPPLRAAVQGGSKVVFLGAGAQTYCPEEKQAVAAFLQEIQPIGLMSRDDDTFAMYSDVVRVVEPGIDCGFFVADAHRPLPLRLLPYVVATFDSREEPPIASGNRSLLRAHHQSWGAIPHSHCANPNTLVSDLPEDYLALYASAEEVHSDRVHACVAALAYGVAARFYGTTRRASLLSAVGADVILNGLGKLDQLTLHDKKARQIEFFAKCLEGAI
jgi:hypothetical protein